MPRIPSRYIGDTTKLCGNICAYIQVGSDMSTIECFKIILLGPGVERLLN